jgi:hypothetical protein
MNCPGSIRLSEGLPGTTSKYATEGTAAHQLGEMCLIHNVDTPTYLGTEMPVETESGTEHVFVTEEMCEAVQVYVDHVRSRVTSEYDIQVYEQEFDLKGLQPPGPMFGTSDAVTWCPETRHLYVDDYKHGVGVAVDAKENSQLGFYGIGAMIALEKKPEYITVAIIQPRGFHPEGPIREHTYTFEEIREFKRDLFEAAEATLDPDAPLVPAKDGQGWCRFCKALAVCPAQRQNAIEVAQMEFDLETVEPEMPKPEILTVDQIKMVLARGKMVVDWISAVESHAVHLLDTGHEVPGYKLVEGRKGNTSWVDPEKAEKYLARRGLKVADRFNKKLITPTQAKKKLKERGEELPESHVTRSEGKPKLVPEGDKRPALSPSAQEDFTVG